MNKIFLSRLFASCLLATFAGSALAEPGPTASAWIEVDSNGSIAKLEWSKRSLELSDAVRAAIEVQLRKLSLKPAPDYANAERVGTTADITTSLDEVGDDLVLRVISVRTGISYSKLKPPRFPQSALRHRAQADLLAKVSVGADGKATAIEIVGASEDNEEFEQSVRDAINGWRFKNETLNGEPVAGTINVPIRFSMACQRGDKGFELSAAAPKQLVLAAGNRANADLIEVAASRRMSGPKPCE